MSWLACESGVAKASSTSKTKLSGPIAKRSHTRDKKLSALSALALSA
eukprot:CAMPEP_0115729424 /NCGR_PEP_ID=MMETSP0272-20121206/83499_1 /TAXON_ID=71861 /ORGANISM="Scrippsiella trochoidea, Strain CCMP3099" /LENGTH=46 /DNA_ID= /DNA_START= /DNA_END= /DNA_ORIENTATION=